MHRLKFLTAVLSCSTTFIVLIGVVYAGSLSPSASPAATSYTLTDIYTRLTTNASATAGNHVFAPAASPSGTLYTLTQIYAAIPTIDATKVGVDTAYLGVSGSLLANLFNGTSGAFTGGSQANGGADDYNNAGAAAALRYTSVWTQCTAGNTYCGTGDSGADAKDNSTGLVWSLPCNGSGCTVLADASPYAATYSWDSSYRNNNSRTASQLCSDHAGWFLPHQKQLMQAYIDGSYGGNLEASGVIPGYWSATTRSDITTDAWVVYLSDGYTVNVAETGVRNVRCVRSA